MTSSRKRRLAVLAAIAAMAVLPYVLNLRWQSIMVLTGEFVLLALGLNVVVGFAGLLDLGYVAFWAIGAYTTTILMGAAPLHTPWVFPVWVAFPAAMIVCMVAGLLLGAPVLRLRGDYLAIVTLGFGEIVRIIAENAESVTRGAAGISNIPDPTVPAWAWVDIPNFFIAIGNGFVHFTNWIWWGRDVGAIEKVRSVGEVHFGVSPKPFYYLLLVIILGAIFVLRRLDNSRIGRAWIAIREDEDAAEAMGVPTLRMKLLAFAIGAGTASFAGVIQATNLGFISPGSFVVIISIQILAMVVLGGLGNMVGAMVGAASITVIPELMRDPSIFKNPSVAQTVENYRFLVFGAVLVVMMIFRPQGIIPSRRRAEEMKRAASEESAPSIPTEMERSAG